MKIYALAVCFASLLCGAITGGVFIYNLVKISFPEATIDPALIRHYSSNEEFRRSPFYPHRAALVGFAANGRYPALPIPEPGLREEPPEAPVLSDDEVKTMREKGLRDMLASHQFRARQGLIFQTIILLISAALFAIHWHLAKKFNHEGANRNEPGKISE